MSNNIDLNTVNIDKNKKYAAAKKINNEKHAGDD